MMKKTIFLLSLLAALSVSAIAQSNVKVYFLKSDEAEADDLVRVQRKIAAGANRYDAAMRALLAGPNAAEKKLGFFAPYWPDSIVNGREECAAAKMRPLADYFIGIRIRRGTAIINFRKGALCYLDTAITQADRTMKPMERTMLQFKGIKGVDYAINGKVIEEWDA